MVLTTYGLLCNQVNWLRKQGACEAATSSKGDMTARNNNAQKKRARKVKQLSAAAASRLPSLPTHGRTGLASVAEHSLIPKKKPKRRINKRNSFESMFFEDTSDLDSSLYTNALEADIITDQLSTQEFIKLGQGEEGKKRGRRAAKAGNVLSNFNLPSMPKQNNNSLLDYAKNRSDLMMQKIESIRASTPDLYTMPSEGKGLAKVDSPRSKYIVGCLAKQMNPRASLIIRKDLTHEFNLAGMGMGDKMAVEFANSIKTIPVVHRINIGDNNLTDKGTVTFMDCILKLDFSTRMFIAFPLHFFLFYCQQE